MKILDFQTDLDLLELPMPYLPSLFGFLETLIVLDFALAQEGRESLFHQVYSPAVPGNIIPSRFPD